MPPVAARRLIPSAAVAPRPANRRAYLDTAGPVAAGTVLSVALWWLYCQARGYALSPDSMQYAALARGIAAGRWFTSDLLWLDARPGHAQAGWPPLYPALLAGVHTLGWSWSAAMAVASAIGLAASTAFGLLALAAVAGGLDWVAVPLVAAFPLGLYAAAHGWSEPVCLALLGLHYWLVTLALRRPKRALWFLQGLAAGLAFLTRYAAAAFLPAAVLLPLLFDCRPRASVDARRLRATWPAATGVALAVVPWTVFALTATGHVGAPGLPVGAGLRGALSMALQGWERVVGLVVLPGGGDTAAVRAAVGHLATLEFLGIAAAVTLPRTLRRLETGKTTAPPRSPWLLWMLAVDVMAYLALLVGLRAHYFFDALGPRLLLPALYPALLLGLALLGRIHWRWGRTLMGAPLAAILLWHGLGWARQAWRQPRLAASLAGPWCQPGRHGDCGLVRWAATHTAGDDLIVGNAGFILNFALGRTTQEVAPYPYNPRLSVAELAAWTQAWEEAHPRGRVWLVLDLAAGPLNRSGPLMTRIWKQPNWSGSATVALRLVTRTPGYGVWALSTTPTA